MKFSETNKKEINRILAEVEEEQAKNGNTLYSFDEIAKEILLRLEKEEKEYRLRNICYWKSERRSLSNRILYKIWTKKCDYC